MSFPTLFAPALAVAALSLTASAQLDLPVPRASLHASVTQMVGTTPVTVDYHRPGVKGRQVFGGLVPYGQVWRAGANENTTLRFDGPVSVEGHELAAGTYGLHTIPGESAWTVILSHNATSWGSYFYDPSEDALRVTVKPVSAPFTEWMSYGFDDLSNDGATLTLRWAELAVPVRIGVDLEQTVLAALRDEYLRGLDGFDPTSFQKAAAWCLANGVNLEEALGWADRSLRGGANFAGLWTRAGLLEALGRPGADEARTQAIALGSETQVNAMGYQYLGAGSVKQALRVFEANVAAHPGSWNAHDSLAEARAAAGDVAGARAAYQKALAMTQDATQKARIEAALAALGKA